MQVKTYINSAFDTVKNLHMITKPKSKSTTDKNMIDGYYTRPPRGYLNDAVYTEQGMLLLPFPVLNKILLPDSSNKLGFLINHTGISLSYENSKGKIEYYKFEQIRDCDIIYDKLEDKVIPRNKSAGYFYEQGRYLFGASLLKYLITENLTDEVIEDNIIDQLSKATGLNKCLISKDANDGIELINGYYVKSLYYKDDLKDAIAEEMLTNASKIKFLFTFQRARKEFMKVFQNGIFVIPLGLRPVYAKREDKITNKYINLAKLVSNIELMIESGNMNMDSVIRYYLQLEREVSGIQKDSDQYDEAYMPLYERIKSKDGLIREDVYGCRIDYSSRAVITVDQQLPIGTIGISLDIFYPLIETMALQIASKEDREKLLHCDKETQLKYAEILSKDKYVIIGRQPTLYYLSMQPRKVKIVDSNAITISPLDTPPFNADFDGDQMYLQMPITEEGQRDAETMYKYRFRFPKDGSLAVELRQEILYGVYCYIKKGLPSIDTTGFSNFDILVYTRLAERDSKTVIAELLKDDISNIKPTKDYLNGRLDIMYQNLSREEFTDLVSTLVNIGFLCAKLYAPNILIEQTAKPAVDVINNVDTYKTYYDMGMLTTDEYKERVTRIFSNIATQGLTTNLLNNSNDWMDVVNSGAKGSMSNIQQLMVAKGIIEVQGATVANGVLSCIADGLSSSEMFMSAHGSRKGLIDKTLGPSVPGDLSRRLAFASSNIIINSQKCESEEGLRISKDIIDKVISGFEHMSEDDQISKIRDICKCFIGRYMVGQSNIITKQDIDNMTDMLIRGDEIQIHSPIYCDDKCCVRCYGKDLRENNNEIKLNTRIGYIAAQSLSEPGTQMVMKKFQSGGVKVDKKQLDQGFDTLTKTYDLTSGIRERLNILAPNDIDKQISVLVLFIWDVYDSNGTSMNIKHIETVVSSMVRYIDLSNHVGRIYLKKPKDCDYRKVLTGVTNAISTDSNSFYRNTFEDYSKSFLNSILEDEAYGPGEDRVVCDLAFGTIGERK